MSRDANYGSSFNATTSQKTKKLILNTAQELRRLHNSINQLNECVNNNIEELNKSVNYINNKTAEIEKFILSLFISIVCRSRSKRIEFYL